jgi:SET domain-containing protein
MPPAPMRPLRTGPYSPANRDFVRVGQSRIEGRGLFAKLRIPRGTRVIEYTGARVPITACLMAPVAVAPERVYRFRLSASTSIDATRGGSDARFVNHSCDPNCEAYVFDERVYFYAMRDITRGQELTLDYQLTPILQLPRSSARARAAYACRCGATACRGTMLAPRKRA